MSMYVNQRPQVTGAERNRRIVNVRSKNPRVKLIQQVKGADTKRGMRSGTLNVPAIVGLQKPLTRGSAAWR